MDWTDVCVMGLNSALGVYDGKVYDALWERTKLEPLNEREVPEVYEVSFFSLPPLTVFFTLPGGSWAVCSLLFVEKYQADYAAREEAG
jgi:hypothetical protein